MKNLLFTLLLICAVKANAQNVGLGTITPLMPLHVSKLDSALLLLENQNPPALGVNTGLYFKTGTRYTGAVKSIATSAADARLGFFTFSTVNQNSLKENMTILDDGKVGIGINAPTALLDVNGSLRIRGNGAGDGKVLTGDASGNATWQTLPSTNSAFSIGVTAPLSVNNSFFNIVPFNNKSSANYKFDDGNNFNTGTFTYVVPSDGVYNFHAGVSFNSGTATADGYIRVMLNINGGFLNTTNGYALTYTGKPLPPATATDATVKLAAGATVAVQVYNNSGTTITISGGETSFSGSRIY